MKSVAFDYVRAKSLDEVCQLLARQDGESDTSLLAGGQSLVPLMAMRLARPTRLIDLNHVAELSGIELSGNRLRIGAMTRQRQCELDPLVQRHLPLLAKALPQIGHIQTRNRGTIGGSLAQADPASEIPLTILLLSAELTLRNSQQSRNVAIEDFFQGPMTTAIGEDEVLCRIEFPLWQEGDRIGAEFVEMAPRQGDYALVSAAAQIALDDQGYCRRAVVGVGACGSIPIRLTALENDLIGQNPAPDLLERLSQSINDQIEPEDSTQASADYRRRVAPVLLFRALSQAVAKAQQGQPA